MSLANEKGLANEEAVGYKSVINGDYETKGFFRKAIPLMPQSLAIMCCIFNILFPGLGKFWFLKRKRETYLI